MKRFAFARDGVRLAGTDTGGAGPPVVLLHGLAGFTGEWEATTAGPRERFRVVALDARGHGGSERYPADVSRDAHVADVIAAVERLALTPVGPTWSARWWLSRPDPGLVSSTTRGFRRSARASGRGPRSAAAISIPR